MSGRGVVSVSAALRGLLAFMIFAAGALAYRGLSGRPGRSSTALIVMATVLVALVLWWAQAPIERLAYRVVHRQRADAEATMDALLRGMSQALPVDEVVVRLAEAAGRNRQQAEVRVWLADGSSWGQAWPSAQASAGEVAYRVDVRHGGDRVGEIEIAADTQPLTPFDRRLLDDLAAPAGVALSTVRLTVDLRRREAELTELNRALAASTERLRHARAEQRDRLRAEIGKRVLPHVSSALAELDQPRPDPSAVRREVGLALDQLRILARGIHPPRLSEDGLVASLDGWKERRDRHVAITGAPLEKLPESTLRVAYFCAVTLLDALADAGAERLEFADGDGDGDGDGELRFEIRGRLTRPGAPDRMSVQLTRDRLEAFDGTLTSAWTPDTATFGIRLPRERAGERSPR